MFPTEPRHQGWRHTAPEALADLIGELAGTTRPLVAVDGRSGGGKSTFAALLVRVLDADLVHTDDVAWYESFFGWDELLRTGVLEPWRSGQVVDFRPPAWDLRGRPGSITADPTRPLVLEGVGAARPELTDLADLVVWVESDRAEARRRGVARDVVTTDRNLAQAERFWDEWEAQEVPFQDRSRPWERAGLVVLGTPEQAGLEAGATWVVVPGRS